MGYNNYSGGNRGFSGRAQRSDLSEVKPAVEIKSFYKEGTDIPLEDLFDGQAKKIAESFVGKGFDGKDIGISSTKIRKVFDEVKRYETIMALPNAKWEDQLPFIKMIKSKVAYNIARASRKSDGKSTKEAPVYKNFQNFLVSGIDLIKTQHDYNVFTSLFEAVYGYYYELAPKDYQK